MKDKAAIVPYGKIEERILLIRGQRVMLDADLAELYGVSTKRLNEQVRRNRSRFPADFMFQLTKEEKRKVVTNCDHLAQLKYAPSLPFAFTEHGAVMVASVLNSARAVTVSSSWCGLLLNCGRCWQRTRSWGGSWPSWKERWRLTTRLSSRWSWRFVD